MKIIPHSRPTVREEDVSLVSETVRSGYHAQGEMVKKLEGQLAQYLGLPHAVATSSGTAALHIALLALEVGLGDEVIIPSYTCSSLLQAVAHTRADPVVVDVDPRTGNIDPEKAEKKVGPKTKAIVVAHMFGHSAELQEMASLGPPIIEDFAQALGAEYEGQQVGQFSRLAICSFYATKMISTGEGGVVVTGEEVLAERIRDLRSLDLRDDHQLRFNYKMTDIQAALGVSQIKRLPDFIKRRRTIAKAYDRAFEGLSVVLPPKNGSCRPVYFRYVLQVEGGSEHSIEEARRQGVMCDRPVFKPLHRYLGHPPGEFPSTEALDRKALSVPIYPSLTEVEVSYVARVVEKALVRKET